jgi:hypothetical protein
MRATPGLAQLLVSVTALGRSVPLRTLFPHFLKWQFEYFFHEGVSTVPYGPDGHPYFSMIEIQPLFPDGRQLQKMRP